MSVVIERNASLQAHNSLGVPAHAAALARVATIEELNLSLDLADAESLPVLVLGEGSNTVFENDYAGLVVLNRLTGIEVLHEDEHTVRVSVGAGENWHEFVHHSLQQAWYGLENLALIPGLVGAAPIQNIGAYGTEVKDTLRSVTALDVKTRECRTFTKAECNFAYRDSRFKQELAGRVIIVAVEFALNKQANLNLSYPALSEYLPQDKSLISPIDVFEAVCSVRSAKLPSPSDIPNAGSFFKNPIVNARQHTDLCARYPQIVSFPLGDNYKLAAAWLIEQAGWKQQEIEGVTVHANQALVVINPKQSSGASIMRFARAIQADIKDKFGVGLEVEPRVY